MNVGVGRKKILCIQIQFHTLSSFSLLCCSIDWSSFERDRTGQFNLIFSALCFLHDFESKHIKTKWWTFSPLITLHLLWLTADIYFSVIWSMLLLNVKKQSNLSHTVYGKLSIALLTIMNLCHYYSVISAAAFFLSKYKAIK